MRFVWFWTFWHWSKESFRDGSLLRSPLPGVGSHWDEWFRHEASEGDLQAIRETGRTESNQRRFIAWFYLHWAPEANWNANRLIPRFVLGQLAHLSPFKEWQAFDEYRASYGIGGLSAIVLTAESSGQAEEPEGGPNTRAEISGKVSGELTPDLQVVIYARADAWYIQPDAYALHSIRSNNTWSSWTHTGSSYAAVVVRPGFDPFLRLDVLPQVGGYVVARTIVEGTRK